MNQWVADQMTGFQTLAGCVITSWVGVEMALRENGSSGQPDFEDLTIPLLQVGPLYAEAEGRVRRIGTYQNDTNWGLCIEYYQFGLPPEDQAEGSILRTRCLRELPLGLVTDVTTALDRVSDLVEVTITIGRRDIVLQAGEVYEEGDGSLFVNRPDESILISVVIDQELNAGE